MISGPSFLGLNQPGPATAPRAELRSFDYLLEEEEPERKGGKGKYLLILLALVLALGVGYLRWKNQTQGWFSANKPAAEQTADDANANSAAASAVPAAPAPDAAKNQTAPPTNATEPSTGSSTPAAVTPGTDGASANSAPDGANKDAPASGAAADNANSDAKNEPGETADSEASAPVKPPPAARPAKAKPSPAIQPAQSSNAVTEATRYIYGKGAAQDCDRGLRLLKPAANKADPRAMIEMGALYSAGLCTPRDLPTAYRWFAMALRKEPDNISVQGDLQKLWGEMTQPERQLAIRLTH
jgi:TPR repeat protein